MRVITEKKSNDYSNYYFKGGLAFETEDDYNSIWNIEKWFKCLYEKNAIFYKFYECNEDYLNNIRNVGNLILGIEENCFYFRNLKDFEEQFPYLSKFYKESSTLEYYNRKIRDYFEVILGDYF